MTSDPEQIRGQMTQTQRNLSTDVDALSEKLSPQRIAQRRVQRTRTAMTSMREKIMGSAYSGVSSARDMATSQSAAVRDSVSSAASSAADSASSLAGSAGEAVSAAPDMVKQRTEGNPLAAGLIAFGAGWLISSLLPATSAEQRMTSTVKDAASEYGQPVARQASQAAQEAKDQLGDSVRQAAGAVRETASDAVSAVKDEAQSATDDVSGRAGQAKERVRGQSRPAGA